MKGYCDCCQRCYATNKAYVQTTFSIVTEINLCKKCEEIMNNDDFVRIAEYTLVREKILFLRNMPPTLEERLERVEQELKEERDYAKSLENELEEYR